MKCLYSIGNHTVYRFSMPVIDSSMYLVAGEDSCLIVDPCVSKESEKLLCDLRIRDCWILLTHEHYDHISGVNRLRELLPCRVICSEACAARLGSPKTNCAAYSDALAIAKSEQEQMEFSKVVDKSYSCRADWTYSGQSELQWRDLILTLREAPGHSPGSQIIEIGKHWYFTGDSLIPGTGVITRFPGGSRKAYENMTKPYLENIAPGSILFPGHGAETVFDGGGI